MDLKYMRSLSSEVEKEYKTQRILEHHYAINSILSSLCLLQNYEREFLINLCGNETLIDQGFVPDHNLSTIRLLELRLGVCKFRKFVTICKQLKDDRDTLHFDS